MTHVFSGRQTIGLMLYGATLWFVAAMIVRFVGPMGAFSGQALLVTYALVIPGTVPAIWLMEKLFGIVKGKLTLAVALVTATALILDGIALNFFRAVYGSDPAITNIGAALILWGAGIGLFLGFLMEAQAGKSLNS
jgi:hypothetical protein